jgi:hypothetical protein
MSKIIWKEIIHPVNQQKQQDTAFFYHNRKPNQKLFLIYVLKNRQTTESIKEWHLDVYSMPNENIMQNPNKENLNQSNKIGNAIFTYNAKIDRNRCWLANIFVKGVFRGQKIGSRLLGLANALAQAKKIPNWKIACLRAHDSVLGYTLSDTGTALINYYILRHPTFSYRVILPKNQMKNDGLPNIQTEFIPPNIIKENSVEYADSQDSTDSQYDKGKKPPPELLATFYNAQGELLRRKNKLYEAHKMFLAAVKKTNVQHRVYGRIYTNIYHLSNMSKTPYKAEIFRQKFIKRLEDKLKYYNNLHMQKLIHSHLKQIKDCKLTSTQLPNKIKHAMMPGYV